VTLLVDFKARFPEIDTAKADILVPIYEPTYPCYFGGDYLVDCDKQAILLLMAHLITTDPSYTGKTTAAPSKAVASKSVGSVSTSFVAGVTGNDLKVWLNSTRYGQLFLMVTSSNTGPKFL
jgi:hypothetical protein